MGAKRPSGTVFDTLSTVNTSDRKFQPGGKVSLDPSPRPAMSAKLEKGRDVSHEEGWRREREMEKARDKGTYRDHGPRDRYYERHRGPVPRQREWSERERWQENERRQNMRPLSSVEKETERYAARGMNKGDTFPRMTKNSGDRGGRVKGENDGSGEQRRRDRPKGLDADDWEREYEREQQREGCRVKDREEMSGRLKEEGPRRRERDDSWERRERDTARKREKPRSDMGKREPRVASPYRQRDRDIYSDRVERDATHRRQGQRDTRSEGDSDEREMRKERDKERDREYHHSRSDGDGRDKPKRDRYRDRQGYRDEDKYRYRDRDREREVDRSRRRDEERDRERYREDRRSVAWEAEREGERWKDSNRDLKGDRRRHDVSREPKQEIYRERKEKEEDHRREDSTGRDGRAQSDTTPRAPPRAQSSGEWSSTDVDEQRTAGGDDDRRRREQDRHRRGKTEQRRMWLEPQRGINSRGNIVDEGTSTSERNIESLGEWGRGEQRVKEEPDEVYSDQRRHTERYRSRNEQSGNTKTEGVSVDGEMYEVWREKDKEEREQMSGSHRGADRRQDVERENMMEESDRDGGSDYWARSESEGGSDTDCKQEKDKMLSGEDDFVTISSGGDEQDEREEDEEQYEDCQEYLEGGDKDHSPGDFVGHDGDKETEQEWTTGKEETVDEDDQASGKQPQYVFCVIGQTLPREKAIKKTPPEVDRSPEEDGPGEPNTKWRDQGAQRASAQEAEVNTNLEAEDRTRGKVLTQADLGPITRDSLTERLLTEWRQKNNIPSETESEHSLQVPDNPYGDVYSKVDFEQIQPILEELGSGTMSPDEVEAIRIRLSGAWTLSEEPKQHSQAPHLKWAKNVVQEILGNSEEGTVDEISVETDGDRRVNQSENTSNNVKQQVETTREPGEVPLDLRMDAQHSDAELDMDESLELEGLRDDEDDRSRSWEEVELRNVLDTIQRRKRNSRFFNAAQLYQQYNEAAQNFEILRQARSDGTTVSEDTTPSLAPSPSPPPARRPLPPLPSAQTPHRFSHTGSITSVQSLPLPEPPKIEGRPPSPRLSISLSKSSSLWRELPGVRNSSELEELTEDQRRLQEVRFEVVTSEASYCRSLDIVVEHFVKSKQLGALLGTQDRNWLFSRLADVRAISHSFLSKLEERVESNLMSFTVCDIIAKHCQRFKMVYVPYLTNQSYQDATYQRLMNENPGFRRIVEKLEQSVVCQRLPLRSFLVLPFQRITRLKLLVQNIVKRTTPGTTEATQAIKALKLLAKLIQESNDSITQMKSIESLVSLSAKVDFECRTLPLISQSRRMIREGPVTELMDFSLKDTERSVYLHLFNDYLLLSLQKEGGRFTVVDHSPVSVLRVENCRVKLHSLQKNLFRVHMSTKALLLRTDALSDKLRWISALSRPHPEIDFSAAQDFPQMQCIRAFVAQQPDELSLEKADIILVHQQSTDHWVEGTRLSDRHRGWLPASHLETITNSRVRQHNLEDALKVSTATAAV
ncbi:trichohyalin isoform X2 [Takifugu rubripes]|uniref:trichohyalin isoform X2 n=1 Tax=Takifugu rubripes TaxID=31033 RepID=UPI00114586BF|nr:trichohyalin-like isoform X2 [Takifugu rubripes]